MDLKNLASRYSKVSDEMEGNRDALNLIRGEAADAVGKSKPSLVEADIRKEAIKPGFLSWKEDQPILSVKGRTRITGKDFDLETALQDRFEDAPKQPVKQGKPLKEFPNVEAVVVEAEDEDGDEEAAVVVAEKKELGQAEVSRLDALFSSNLRRALTMAGVFSLGVAAGWWLAKKY